jgi:hypothetical protein
VLDPAALANSIGLPSAYAPASAPAAPSLRTSRRVSVLLSRLTTVSLHPHFVLSVTRRLRSTTIESSLRVTVPFVLFCNPSPLALAFGRAGTLPPQARSLHPFCRVATSLTVREVQRLVHMPSGHFLWAFWPPRLWAYRAIASTAGKSAEPMEGFSHHPSSCRTGPIPVRWP